MMFRALEALFHYHREGGIDDWGANSYRATMVDFMGFPGFKQYWTDRRHWFSAEFQQEVDQWLSKPSESSLDKYYGERQEVERKSEPDGALTSDCYCRGSHHARALRLRSPH